MAMLGVLRNTCSLSGVNVLKSIRFTPLKTFTSSPLKTLTSTALLAPKKGAQLSLLKPLQRNISVTAPLLSHSHSGTWVAEKVLTASFLVVFPLAFMFPSQIMDCLMATTIVMHQHWGLEAIATDYARLILPSPIIPKLAHALVFISSALTLGGLYYFIYNDVGIAKGFKQFWAIKGAKKQEE